MGHFQVIFSLLYDICIQTKCKLDNRKPLTGIKKVKELLAKGKKLSNEEGKDDLDEVEDDDEDTAVDEADFKGLGTGLRPVERMKCAPKGSEDLKHFLHRLETTLLEKVKYHTPPPKSRKDKEFNNLFVQLQKESK
eukprot:5912900-Ditylum_brightwellii.AAC.1